MVGRRSAFSSSIATKVLLAVTGLLLFVYLVIHLVGNTTFFLGPNVFNQYAHALTKSAGPIILIIEIGLAAIFLLHIYEAVTNWWANRQARPVPYVNKRWAGPPSRKTIASSTMIYTGAIVLLFVVLHLRAFKFGTEYAVPGTDVRDLYRLELEVFGNPLIVGFYMACMVLLGFHLWHGFSSAFQSLGADHPKYTPWILTAGKVLALVIAGGFFVIPLLVYFMGARS